MLLTITESAREHFKYIISLQAKEMKVKLLNLKIKATNNINNNTNTNNDLKNFKNLKDPKISNQELKPQIELSYCLPGEEEPSDIVLDLQDFILYVDQNSKDSLLDAIIDYRLDSSVRVYENVSKNIQKDHTHFKNSYKNNNYNNGKLHIKAPFLYKASNSFNYASVNNINANTKNLEDSVLCNEINQFIIQEINPWLARHNGMVRLVNLDESKEGITIFLEFGGGCKGCSMVNFTLKRSIEKTLKNKFKEIILIKDITDHITGKNPYYL